MQAAVENSFGDNFGDNWMDSISVGIALSI